MHDLFSLLQMILGSSGFIALTITLGGVAAIHRLCLNSERCPSKEGHELAVENNRHNEAMQRLANEREQALLHD